MPEVRGTPEIIATPEVRILPEIIANKIAAGEVVERPASVVKELIENSIDARAKRITVEIEKGGSDLIRVSDDGHGMSRDNALLSIQRYATSKIINDDDLFSIKTFGFRGEAIPSMASVSNFTLITREEHTASGTRIDISGGKLQDVSETGAPAGTMIEVRNIYFNTPARRKFLKTTNTEMGHIASTVAGFALASPDVQFRLINNGRTVKHFSESEDLLSRVGMVLGIDDLSDLYPIDISEKDISEKDGLYITGYTTKPSVSRNSSNSILLFVNKRMVSDRALVSAILRGYKGRLMKGQYPLSVLFMNVPFDEVDVNVHPAKLQVRFANQSLVFGSVVNAVHNALYHGEKNSTLLAGKSNCDPHSITLSSQIIQLKKESDSDQYPVAEKIEALKEVPFNKRKKTNTLVEEHEHIDIIAEQVSNNSAVLESVEPAMNITDMHVVTTHEPVPEYTTNIFTEPDTDYRYPKTDEGFQHQKQEDSHHEECFLFKKSFNNQTNSSEKSEMIKDIHIIGQFANTYIIAESRSGMILIDQHAAHERVVYQRLKERSQGFRAPSQDMIIPEIIELNYKESANLEKMLPQLIKMGIEIEHFGGTSFAVKSVPAIIDNKSIKPMLRDMLGMMASSGLDIEDGSSKFAENSNLSFEIGSEWLDNILILMACHSAIRANHSLDIREMKQLVSDLALCENPYHCPHGRPTIILFSQKELEKRFKRRLT